MTVRDLAILVAHPRNEFIPLRVQQILGSAGSLRVRVVRNLGRQAIEELRELSSPRIFVPHWSKRIPPDVFFRFETICFHMTDLPFGRGGSPLQNLIARNLASTKLTAFRCTEDLDAGPIYDKRELGLDGTAEEILHRTGMLVAEMIADIVRGDIQPSPQAGLVTYFRRRQPEESEIPRQLAGRALYDFIRMLDADGYPRAFVRHGRLRLVFSDASLAHDGSAVTARVTLVDDTSSPR